MSRLTRISSHDPGVDDDDDDEDQDEDESAEQEPRYKVKVGGEETGGSRSRNWSRAISAGPTIRETMRLADGAAGSSAPRPIWKGSHSNCARPAALCRALGGHIPGLQQQLAHFKVSTGTDFG